MPGSHRLRPTRNSKQGLRGPQSGTIHERLDDPSGQIRLLLATESSQDDTLNFAISTHSLANVPAYHAISYTWGKDESQRSVLINEVEFHVNQNCYYALWQACLHYSHTPLWIDSLCIDQGNSAEKSAQVWIMPEIYRGAARVLACVGPHADDSMLLALAVPGLERLSQLERSSSGASCESEDQVKDLAQLVFEELGQQRLSDLFWAFCGFKQRLYWKRVWIQQEIGLAANLSILCGHDILFLRSIELHRELYFASWVHTQQLFSKADRMRINNSAESVVYDPFQQIVYLITKDLIEFGTLLSFSAGLECEDFHDRVYGVLGLTSSWIRNYILPDYNLTAIQLAVQVAGVLPFHRGLLAIESLENDIEDEELRLLVERVHSSDAMVDHLAPKTNQHCRCFVMHEDREYTLKESERFTPSHQAFDSCHQYTLRTNGAEQLTIDLEGFPYFDLHWFPEDNNDIDTQALPASAKRIIDNEKTVGFICQTVRDGDIVLKLSRMKTGDFLVLRHSEGEFYDLVGRGFLLSGCCLQVIEIAGGKEWESHFARRAVEVRISVSAEESIAFWAAELQERRAEEPDRMIDIISRLNDPITNHPHGAVHVTSRNA